MEIFLTGKCNLNCSYCFANATKSAFQSEMSFVAFNTIIEFAKKNSVHSLRLIGGEPFLHSNFQDFLKIILDDDFFNNVIIYTNGLFDASYLTCLTSDKITVSVNCNSPEVLKQRYETLIDNLLKLKERNIYTGISFNIPYMGFDYNYIFDILSKLNKKALRFSFATSNEEKCSIKNPISYFKDLHDYIMEFYQACYEHGVAPLTSCNSIPMCLLNAEDKRLILKLYKVGMGNADFNILSGFNRCTSRNTILPDLSIIRCFAFPDIKANLKDYDFLEEIETYFREQIDDNKSRFVNSNEQCQNCAFNKNQMCRICLEY